MSRVHHLKTDINEMVLHNRAVQTISTLADEWESATDVKRQKALQKAQLIKPIIDDVEAGYFRSASKAIEAFLVEVKLYGEGRHPLAFELGSKNKPVSRATLHNWFKAFKQQGVQGLLEQRGGSKRASFGWEARALRIWQSPQNRAYTVVAAMLRQEGHASANDDRVRNYLKSLPADLLARGRAGAKLFTNTQRAYKRISTDHLAPGDVYQGDGNTLDIYMQHPTGKRVWRPELTLWIDVASRYVVGWFLSNAESGNSTLFALSHALMSQDHVPAILHIDNGSGFKNKMMSDIDNGWYHKFGMQVMHSRPYNAKGKGRVERFFQTMQEQFLKRFDSYCGKDVDPEHKKRLVALHKEGDANLPTREDFCVLFQEWLDNEYHVNPHRGLDGKSPKEVYDQQRRQEPLGNISEAIFWPRTTKVVNRETVKLNGFEYTGQHLGAYNGRKVIVEYSPHDAAQARMLTENGQWICDAELVQVHTYVTTDRLELARQKTAKAAIKRKFADIQEIERREQLAITHDQKLVDPILDATNFTPVTDHAAEPVRLTKKPSSQTIDLKDLF